jgi:polar amino acid transport system permease protein
MPHFDLDLILHGQYHDWLLGGLLVSLELAGTTLVLALPLAILVALLRLAPNTVLRGLGAVYVESIRNVPLLAHLLFWYFGVSSLLPDAVNAKLNESGKMEFLSATVALTLYTAAYMAEDIRSGIRAVPVVQFEAVRALGLGFLQTMRRVVLPQAMRVTVPPLISQMLNLWKDTSIATVIGVAEMMYQAARVESASFRSAESFAFATGAYLAVSLAITGLATWYHHRYPVRML